MTDDRTSHPVREEQMRRDVRTGMPLAAILLTAVVSILCFTARFSPAQTPMELTRWANSPMRSKQTSSAAE